MKAAQYKGNKTIRIIDCNPIVPMADEVQIAVSYAGICGTDLHIYQGHMDNRVTTPHIMGHEMSGIVSAVGSNVTCLTPGDRVVVMPLISCGQCQACRDGYSHVCHRLKFMGIETSGAFQSYWTVPAHTVLRIPESMPLRIAALIEPLAVACHDVRMGEVREGDYAVVIGGGPIGTLIALTARAAGASVLVSEINPIRLKLLDQLGIPTINPLERNVKDFVEEQTEGAGCDVVFEVTSTSSGAELMTQLPKTRGRIVVVGIFNRLVEVDLHRFFWRELKLTGARVYEKEDYDKAISLAESGRLPLDSLISTILPLEEAASGFQLMEGGDVMKVLLACNGADLEHGKE